jgi:hypothetical protein
MTIVGVVFAVVTVILVFCMAVAPFTWRIRTPRLRQTEEAVVKDDE